MQVETLAVSPPFHRPVEPPFDGHRAYRLCSQEPGDMVCGEGAVVPDDLDMSEAETEAKPAATPSEWSTRPAEPEYTDREQDSRDPGRGERHRRADDTATQQTSTAAEQGPFGQGRHGSIQILPHIAHRPAIVPDAL